MQVPGIPVQLGVARRTYLAVAVLHPQTHVGPLQASSYRHGPSNRKGETLLPGLYKYLDHVRTRNAYFGTPLLRPAGPLRCVFSFACFLLSQLRVQVEDGSNVDFYARHGFVRSEITDEVASGRVLLSGNRDAALVAVRGMVEQENGGAVVMNLMARLLHDAGDVGGAVDAYLKAVQVRAVVAVPFHLCG